MNRVPFGQPAPLKIEFSDVLKRRHSSFGNFEPEPLSLAAIGNLFGHALIRKEGRDGRNYPSGGALYPIETYLLALDFSDGPGGVFHYHPTAHALERLWDIPAELEPRDLVKGPDTLVASALIVFTSVWERSSAKYGDFAYTLALLEAGHMSENVLLAATALGLATRPMAGFDDDAIAKLLDLDEQEEQVVHTITLAKPRRTPIERAEVYGE